MNETWTLKCSLQSWNLWLMTSFKVFFVLHDDHGFYCAILLGYCYSEKRSYLREGVIAEHSHIALAECAELYCCIAMHNLL